MARIVRVWTVALPAFVLALGLALAIPAQAQSGDSQADRVAAAQQLLKVQRMETMMNEMANAIADTLPPGERDSFRKILKEDLDVATLESAASNAMVKIFTARELLAMATFYGSPEGQSIQRKMAPYMAEIMPILQAATLKAAQRYIEQRGLQPPPRQQQR